MRLTKHNEMLNKCFWNDRCIYFLHLFFISYLIQKAYWCSWFRTMISLRYKMISILFSVAADPSFPHAIQCLYLCTYLAYYIFLVFCIGLLSSFFLWMQNCITGRFFLNCYDWISKHSVFFVFLFLTTKTYTPS